MRDEIRLFTALESSGQQGFASERDCIAQSIGQEVLTFVLFLLQVLKFYAAAHILR